MKNIPYTKITYNTNGTYSFTVPPRVTTVKITVAGAGGGGGGWGASAFYGRGADGGMGGRGALVQTVAGVSAGQVLTVVVGAGGYAGANMYSDESYYWNNYESGRGGSGGASYVSGIISAQGGQGGSGSWYGDGEGQSATNGTSYGEGGLGGEGGDLTMVHTGDYDYIEYIHNAYAGNSGWAIIEYGKGIQY